MAQIIASTYEIVQEIGSGGGGIVYLGRHLRLGKWVVLKADRRTLAARPEVLRREVDAMKNLSHTYIPQVYDFVEEDGVVYTVMDYVEGESLDKPLRRGERFAQAQVVEWACQLLEALCYLHSRPPHGILHGDIKPANVMLTPENDIRLIDFNIALALGEEGAVRVGFSRGYASPEHYGVDYAAGNATQGVNENVETQCTDDPGKTVLSSRSSPSPLNTGSSGQRGVLLDVRSDIYSLGATLYHLLTGTRPAQDAREVVPISGSGISPGVAAIIQKAMAPNPGQRYQSAADMLYDFEHLWEQDPRVKRRRRRKAAAAAALALVFLAGGFTAFTGLKRQERLQNAYVLAEYAQNALAEGDRPEAVSTAMEALTLEQGWFDPPNTPQAQAALTDGLGVYDLSDGFKVHRLVSLPSELLKVVLSPQGTRTAAVYAYRVAVLDTETGEQLADLALEPSALADVVFLDEDRLVYAGENGICAYDAAAGRELWSGSPATNLVASGDGTRVAAVYKDAGEAAVYDVNTGSVVQTVSFQGKNQPVTVNDRLADPEDSLLALNQDGTMLAVSFSDGTLSVFDMDNPDGTLEILDPSAYTRFGGGFFGDYFAFSAYGEGDSLFAIINIAEMYQTGAFAAQDPFLTQVDETGIYLGLLDTLVQVDPETGEQTELAFVNENISHFCHSGNYTLLSTEGRAYSFFDRGAVQVEETQTDYSCDFLQIAGNYAVVGSRDTPELRILKLESHPEAELFSYDPSYAHNEARVSADGSTVMLFRYDGFRLFSMDGELLAEVEIPQADQVYDQQYRREGSESYLEVIYNDGLVRTYSAEDGSLRSETQGALPDLSLYEEFITDTLRITAPLHETPAAYDRETGELIRELEKDAYLTYVTQVGDYVITEYISAQGERYGLLLNEDCETLARLPDLCDIVDGKLVFDYPSGNLRLSRIYSLQELMALGESV